MHMICLERREGNTFFVQEYINNSEISKEVRKLILPCYQGTHVNQELGRENIEMSFPEEYIAFKNVTGKTEYTNATN